MTIRPSLSNMATCQRNVDTSICLFVRVHSFIYLYVHYFSVNFCTFDFESISNLLICKIKLKGLIKI